MGPGSGQRSLGALALMTFQQRFKVRGNLETAESNLILQSSPKCTKLTHYLRVSLRPEQRRNKQEICRGQLKS